MFYFTKGKDFSDDISSVIIKKVQESRLYEK